MTYFCGRLCNSAGVEFGPEWECELEADYCIETDSFFVLNVSHYETPDNLRDLSNGDAFEREVAFWLGEQAHKAFKTDKRFRDLVMDDLGISYRGRGGADPDGKLVRERTYQEAAL